MGKLLIIGIDALDAVQFNKLRNHLPVLSSLRDRGFYTQFSSVWPPDSETAWASIYTGWNPARHGIFRFVDPLEKTSKYIAEERNNDVIKGNTFWDIASEQGRRVLVLFPHIGYPSWDVRGIMVTKASVGTDISVFPPDLYPKYNLEGLNDVKGLAGRNPSAYLEANRTQVHKQLDFTLDIMQKESWDVCFTYWSALDLIQHQFWAYCDPADPTFPGENPYQNAINDFYVLHDQVVGQLISAAGKDATVIVMSDHGHGMRPVNILNVNRLLSEHGLLKLKHASKDTRVSLAKSAKAKITNLISDYHLGDIASKVLKWMPWAKKMFVSAANLDFDRSIAYVTDMSGIKAYSYGGIRILKENLSGRTYNEVCSEIIEMLMNVRAPDDPGTPLVEWVKRREELYAGPYLEEYPDLVFELCSSYGVGWDASGALFDISLSHNLYPGSHYGSNAVFFLFPSEGNLFEHKQPLSLMDIAPTVLSLLDVKTAKNMDGKSLI